MQQKLRLNPHGVAGILSIVLMFGIAFFLNWNVNWWYFVIAVVLYSCAVIFLSTQKENYTPTYGGVISNYEWLISRCLFGCHLALLFLAVGLLLHFPGYITGLGGFPGLYFLASVVGGFAIPFMLLGISKDLQKM